MSDKCKLSNRLKTIAHFLPEKAFFADIGSDHAFLPRFVCLRSDQAQAIAGEVSEGPYKAACMTVDSSGLSKQINVRLGDGLEVIRNDSVTEVVIAGMGGTLITKILEKGKKFLATVERIILQPNIGEKNVRKWLYQNGFAITSEKVIRENNHFYEIIVADKDPTVDLNHINVNELIFGPVLLQNKNKEFYEKWKSQYKKTEQILRSMKHSTHSDVDKQIELTNKLALIKEVLLSE